MAKSKTLEVLYDNSEGYIVFKPLRKETKWAKQRLNKNYSVCPVKRITKNNKEVTKNLKYGLLCNKDIVYVSNDVKTIERYVSCNYYFFNASKVS